jgi:hypothetical protein
MFTSPFHLSIDEACNMPLGHPLMNQMTVPRQASRDLRRGDPAPLERIYADDYTHVTSLSRVRTRLTAA